MNTITKHVVLLVLCLIASTITAQEKQNTVVKDTIPYRSNGLKIDRLEETKKTIANEEREFLKQEVEVINQRLERGEITNTEAEQLKKEAALRRAANIEDRIAIIDAKINLLKRNPDIANVPDDEDNSMSISIGTKGFVIDLEKDEKKPPKYDIRTTNKLLFSIGFNNAIGDGQDLSNTPYELGGSGFLELGWIWETRLAKNSNFARLNYGLAFQWNKLNVKDDLYFVQNDDETILEEFPVGLRKSQLRVTNLVVPVHFEFGPSRLKEYKNRIRYFTDRKFKVGIGGYAGVRLATQRKLRYKEDGDFVKEKSRRNFNASNFVYGLSGYVGIGQIALYAKYDLNPLFKDQAIDQHNVSLGLRFDLH